MEIHEWLSRHPAIKVYFIERTLGIPRGTIRLTRAVPEKYKSLVGGFLKDYGYGSSVVVIKAAEMVTVLPKAVKKVENKYYTVKEGKLYAIKEDVEEKRWDGKMGIVTRKVDDIPDGSTVVV